MRSEIGGDNELIDAFPCTRHDGNQSNRMTQADKTILVTGVAGFLGCNLLTELLARGHRVIGIDNLSMGSSENISAHLADPAFTFLQRDITDAGAFADVPRDIDCVVHLAAFKIPRYGKAIDTLRINQRGCENVLELCVRHHCKCVLASTSDVYGRNPKLPFAETDDCVIGSSKIPRWAYAVSKLFDEQLAFAYQDSYGIPVTLLRLFGSYGPNQHLSWWGGPPPVFIDAALRGEQIPIHGDGLQTRSFTFVSDTIAGIYAAIVKDAANGEIVNIGNTEEIAIVDLARLVWRLIDPSAQPRLRYVPYESFTGKPYDDVRRRVPDVSLCARVLGVTAKVSLEHGLTRTIDWQRTARAACPV
ncbi:MAG: NAD-dependent epimerase/dehydratase family protein [Betaproteobacteria bacterium]